jgi:hypothetical protein
VNKEQITILTKKTKHGSHQETKVFIDWTGITEAELIILARRALIYNFQIGVTKDLIPGVPEHYVVDAKAAAEDRTPHMVVVFAPKVEKCKDGSWDDPNDIEKLLDRLSPEERKVLLEGL